VQVRTEGKAVKHTVRFNLQRLIHVKPRLKQRRSQAKHVKLCRELLSRSQKLLSLRQKLLSLAKNFLALQKTCQHERKHILILSVRVGNAGKFVSWSHAETVTIASKTIQNLTTGKRYWFPVAWGITVERR
jgi:hypothetical protein